MSSTSDYLEGKIGNHLLRSTSFTAPTTYHFALFTSAPSDSGGGTEVSGGAYARASFAQGDATWNDHSGIDGLFNNKTVITFPVPTDNWGTVTHVGVFDAASGGNLMWHGALNQSLAVNNGDAAPKFAPTDFSITIA